MPSMTIRPIQADRDADQIVALLYTTNPMMVTNAAEWRSRRAAMPDRAKLVSLGAELDGRIVGSVEAGLELFGNGEVGRLELRVEPTSRRKGVGTELYRLGIEHIRTLGVKRVTSSFFESETGVAFAGSRGWTQHRAEVLSTLDPRTVSEPADKTIEIVAARHLYPRDLHRIDEEATRDMPAAETIQEIPYDEWLEFVWHNPLFTSDGSFGAVIDGRVVAVSLLLANFEWGRAVSMFTGTSREHRGRGLARAVKLASIRWAAGNGITQLVTTNDETNASMLAVNGRLGYTPTGRRVSYLLEGERLAGQRGENL
jgi:GNAT superfamily N-acetyltransferase